MKYLLLFVIFISDIVSLHAQTADTVEYFMDYEGNTCGPDSAYYYRLAYKDGEWWKVKDFYLLEKVKRMDGYFKTYSNGMFDNKQGMFFYYHPNGSLDYKVRYINNIREGLLKAYNDKGRIIDSSLYKEDQLTKFRYKWNDAGNVICKGVYDAEGSGKGTEEYFFDNGSLSAKGNVIYTEHKDSIWTYYHNNGQVSCTEQYEYGRCTERKCYDMTGKLEGDCEEMIPPYYNKKRNNRYHIVDPDLLDDVQADYVTFTVKILIDADGRVLDAEMLTKALATNLFYKRAMQHLMHMPRWTPGKEHNRPVKMYTDLWVTVVRRL